MLYGASSRPRSVQPPLLPGHCQGGRCQGGAGGCRQLGARWTGHRKSCVLHMPAPTPVCTHTQVCLCVQRYSDLCGDVDRSRTAERGHSQESETGGSAFPERPSIGCEILRSRGTDTMTSLGQANPWEGLILGLLLWESPFGEPYKNWSDTH